MIRIHFDNGNNVVIKTTMDEYVKLVDETNEKRLHLLAFNDNIIVDINKITYVEKILEEE